MPLSKQEGMKLNKTEKVVLKLLAEEMDPAYGEHQCFYTIGIQRALKLNRIQARRALRALVSKGLAELVTGLINEDTGLLAGSGYSGTDDGYRYAKDNGLLEEV